MNNDNKNETQVANQLADLAAIWMKEAKEKMEKQANQEAPTSSDPETSPNQ